MIRINLNIIQDLNILLGTYYNNDNIKFNNNKRILKEYYGSKDSEVIKELKKVNDLMIYNNSYTITNKPEDKIYNTKYNVDIEKYKNREDIIENYMDIINTIINRESKESKNSIIYINIISYEENIIYGKSQKIITKNIVNDIYKNISSYANVTVNLKYKMIDPKYLSDKLKYFYDVYKDKYINTINYNKVLILYNYNIINDSYYKISEKNIYKIKGNVGKLKPTDNPKIYNFYDGKKNYIMEITKTYGSINLKYKMGINSNEKEGEIEKEGELELFEKEDKYRRIKSINFKGNNKETIFYIPKNNKLNTNKINKEIKDKKLKGLDIFNLKNMKILTNYELKNEKNTKTLSNTNINEIVKLIDNNKIFKSSVKLTEREFNYKLISSKIIKREDLKEEIKENGDIKDKINNYDYVLLITLELFEKNDKDTGTKFFTRCRNTLKQIEKNIFSLKLNTRKIIR
mgnify:FL=1